MDEKLMESSENPFTEVHTRRVHRALGLSCSLDPSLPSGRAESGLYARPAALMASWRPLWLAGSSLRVGRNRRLHFP